MWMYYICVIIWCDIAMWQRVSLGGHRHGIHQTLTHASWRSATQSNNSPQSASAIHTAHIITQIYNTYTASVSVCVLCIAHSFVRTTHTHVHCVLLGARSFGSVRRLSNVRCVCVCICYVVVRVCDGGGVLYVLDFQIHWWALFAKLFTTLYAMWRGEAAKQRRTTCETKRDDSIEIESRHWLPTVSTCCRIDG